MPGLQRYREASLVAAEGLKLDPFNLELKKMSEEATQGTLRDLLTGIGRIVKTHVTVCHDTLP